MILILVLHHKLHQNTIWALKCCCVPEEKSQGSIKILKISCSIIEKNLQAKENNKNTHHILKACTFTFPYIFSIFVTEWWDAVLCRYCLKRFVTHGTSPIQGSEDWGTAGMLGACAPAWCYRHNARNASGWYTTIMRRTREEPKHNTSLRYIQLERVLT